MADDQSDPETPHYPIDDVETETVSTEMGDGVVTTEAYAPSKWTVTSISPFSSSWEWTGVGDRTAHHSVGERDWEDDTLTIDGETVLEGSVTKEEAALELKSWGVSRTLAELVEVIETERLARSYFDRDWDEKIPQEPTVEVPAPLIAELAAYAGREWVVGSPTMSTTKKLLKEASDDD